MPRVRPANRVRRLAGGAGLAGAVKVDRSPNDVLALSGERADR